MCRGSFLLVLPFLLAACVQTNVTRMDVDGPFSERRMELHPDAPSVSAELGVEGRTIVARVKTAACKMRRTWVSEHVETTRKRGNVVTGVVLAAAGLTAIAAAGAIAQSQSTKVECHDLGLRMINGVYVNGGTDCESSSQDATLPVALAISGLAAALAGTVVLLVHKRPEITRVSVPHEQETLTPCVLPNELDQMELAVEIAPDRWLPIPLESDGSGRVDLPVDAALSSGASLPVVVFAVPPSAEGVLERGHPIGSVVVP